MSSGTIYSESVSSGYPTYNLRTASQIYGADSIFFSFLRRTSSSSTSGVCRYYDGSTTYLIEKQQYANYMKLNDSGDFIRFVYDQTLNNLSIGTFSNNAFVATYNFTIPASYSNTAVLQGKCCIQNGTDLYCVDINSLKNNSLSYTTVSNMNKTQPSKISDTLVLSSPLKLVNLSNPENPTLTSLRSFVTNDTYTSLCAMPKYLCSVSYNFKTYTYANSSDGNLTKLVKCPFYLVRYDLSGNPIDRQELFQYETSVTYSTYPEMQTIRSFRVADDCIFTYYVIGASDATTIRVYYLLINTDKKCIMQQSYFESITSTITPRIVICPLGDGKIILLSSESTAAIKYRIFSVVES